MEYIFHLRKDVFFHDSPAFPGGKGRRVMAADVAYSFSRIIDSKVDSPGAWIFNYVKKNGERFSFSAADDSSDFQPASRCSPLPPADQPVNSTPNILSVASCRAQPISATAASGFFHVAGNTRKPCCWKKRTEG